MSASSSSADVMTSPPIDEIEFVDAPTLHQLYAQFDIERRIARGELVGHVRRRTERPAAAYLGASPERHAHMIRDYYLRRQQSETARGWMGKTLFLPGTRASYAALALIVGAAIVLGFLAILDGVTG